MVIKEKIFGVKRIDLQPVILSTNIFFLNSVVYQIPKLVVLLFLEIVSNVKPCLVRKGILINIQVSPPNQSLKLTEPAVDDFARAKQTGTIGRRLPRADWIPSLRRFAAAA